MSITLLSIFRRREGMSHEEFVEYYENFHRKIGDRVLAGYASRYIRRFTTPMDGEQREDDADVVMEIEFPSRERMDAFFQSVTDPEIAAMIAEDEKKLFHSPSMRAYLLDERESDMPKVDG